MPQAVLDALEQAGPPAPVRHVSRRPDAVAVVAALGGGVALAALGRTLLVPGGSLMRPTAMVLGVGAVGVLVPWVAACVAFRTRWLWTFAVAAAACTLLAAAWTFFFALPVSVMLDPGATDQAQAALAHARGQQDVHGVAPERCAMHATGNVGPLGAPYRTCTFSTPEAHFVEFEAWGPGRSGGLEYVRDTGPGVQVFADVCARHLVGSWWTVGEPTDANGIPGTCPIGYRYFGGP